MFNLNCDPTYVAYNTISYDKLTGYFIRYFFTHLKYLIADPCGRMV
jgi:hypothetical protein